MLSSWKLKFESSPGGLGFVNIYKRGSCNPERFKVSVKVRSYVKKSHRKTVFWGMFLIIQLGKQFCHVRGSEEIPLYLCVGEKQRAGEALSRRVLSAPVKALGHPLGKVAVLTQCCICSFHSLPGPVTPALVPNLQLSSPG